MLHSASLFIAKEEQPRSNICGRLSFNNKFFMLSLAFLFFYLVIFSKTVLALGTTIVMDNQFSKFSNMNQGVIYTEVEELNVNNGGLEIDFELTPAQGNAHEHMVRKLLAKEKDAANYVIINVVGNGISKLNGPIKFNASEQMGPVTLILINPNGIILDNCVITTDSKDKVNIAGVWLNGRKFAKYGNRVSKIESTGNITINDELDFSNCFLRLIGANVANNSLTKVRGIKLEADNFINRSKIFLEEDWQSKVGENFTQDSKGVIAAKGDFNLVCGSFISKQEGALSAKSIRITSNNKNALGYGICLAASEFNATSSDILLISEKGSVYLAAIPGL